MFAKTQHAARQAAPPPNTPVVLPFKSGTTLWQALFADVPANEQPPFIAIFVRPNDNPHDPDEFDPEPIEPMQWAGTMNKAALERPEIQRIVIRPLFERLHDRYTDVHAIIARNGRVWAADEQDTTTAILTGTPPLDPDEIRLEVPGFFDRCWDFARLFSTSRNPRIKAVGLIVFIAAAILLALSGAFWLFAVYMLGDAIATMLARIVAAHFAFFLLTSLGISAFEIIGAFVPPLRPYAYLTSALDFALHGWYGWGIGVERKDPQAIQGVWGTLFGILSIAPEFCLILFGGMCYYLFPILWRWLPKQIKRMGREGLRAWREPDEDIVEGEYTVEEVRDGRRYTRRLKG